MTTEQKAALIKGATDLLVDVLNKPPGLTFVVTRRVVIDSIMHSLDFFTAVLSRASLRYCPPRLVDRAGGRGD
jgi:hypothetical protein